MTSNTQTWAVRAPITLAAPITLDGTLLTILLTILLTVGCLWCKPADAAMRWSGAATGSSLQNNFAVGGNLRGAYQLSNNDSVGIALRAMFIDRDFREGAAMAMNASVSYRRGFELMPRWGVGGFWGGLVGVGSWTACVAMEQCGGFGPSFGAEVGVGRALASWLRVFSALRVDLQTGLLGPHDGIYTAGLQFGLAL